MRDWSHVAARARGLSTRLLPREVLWKLADEPVAAALTRRGIVPPTSDLTEVEHALLVRRADCLARLARWAGRHAGVLEVIFGEEDRRSVLVLARTLHAGRPGREAFGGLIPTPRLPTRILELLARQADVTALGTLLAALSHPLGPPLLEGHDPVARERAVHRAHTGRLQAAARRGDRFLRRFTALLGAQQAALVAAVRQRGGRIGGGPRAPELSALEAQLDLATRAARLHPLGTAPTVRFALLLRAEAVDLRTLLWGEALQAPAARIRDALVTP